MIFQLRMQGCVQAYPDEYFGLLSTSFACTEGIRIKLGRVSKAAFFLPSHHPSLTPTVLF